MSTNGFPLQNSCHERLLAQAREDIRKKKDAWAKDARPAISSLPHCFKFAASLVAGYQRQLK